MGKRINVLNFGEKLDLLLKSGKTSFSDSSSLCKKLSISSDYFSRIKGGSRFPSEQVFGEITEQTSDSGMTPRDWYDTLENFGYKLGYSLSEIQRITGASSIGLDFHSRSRDQGNVQSVYRVINGYWESFYYSVSTFDKPRISRDLVIIDGVDEGNFIKCRVVDNSFSYSGHCFPVHGNHLYFILEKEEIFDEIIVYLMNRPERPVDPLLDGIILCASGGVQDKVAVPCAARVAFRYLGRSYEEIRQRLPRFNQKEDESLEDALKRQVPEYLNPSKIKPSNKRYWDMMNFIDNAIHPDQIPFALRMERGSKKKE